MRIRHFFLMLIIILLFGCSHVISRELRENTERHIPLSYILNHPDDHVGKIVIIGGIIVKSHNTEEGTYIEVLQKPLDYRGYPEDTDVSYGRFIILYEGYLDPEVYTRGREVTVAGEVIGKKILPLDEMSYQYLLVKSKEIHLLRKSYGFPLRFSIGIWGRF